MKKRSSILMVSVTILAAVLELTGCHHDQVSPAKLILGFGGRSTSSKSFTPDEISVASITIEGTGPGGDKVSASSSDFSPVELELTPGDWVFTAEGLNGKGTQVASGFLQLSLGPSETQSKDILLTPLAGDGSVSLTWTLAGSVSGDLQVRGSLSSAQGPTQAISAAFSAVSAGPLRFNGLRNGSWTLQLELLRDGSPICGLADGVLVAAGMETKLAVAFNPPQASLSLGLVIPDYSSLSFQIEPSQRLIARGGRAVFQAPASGPVQWYAEGALLSATDPRLDYLSTSAASQERIDCVQGSSSLPRSGNAELEFYDPRSLGPLAWAELVDKDLGSSAAQAALRGLGDCRDIAWTADGSRLASAGRSANALSLLETAGPGGSFALASLGGSAEPRLVSPSLLRCLPNGSLLALSDSEGAAYALAIGQNGLSFTGSLVDPGLAGAKDLVLTPDGHFAYVAAQTADELILLALRSDGSPAAASLAAAKDSNDLAAFSKPACLALSPDGGLLALGTTGDDAIYLFNRDSSSNALAFRARLDKSIFPSQAPLSDPCSLAFSPDGASLFALSYYGKAIIRLDRDAGTGLFAAVASAKSGLAGVAGFATPKRLALSPDGRLLALVGSGSTDGLALFGVDGPARLDYLGCIPSGSGKALPDHPSALAFSPDGSMLAVAADGSLSFFTVNK